MTASSGGSMANVLRFLSSDHLQNLKAHLCSALSCAAVQCRCSQRGRRHHRMPAGSADSVISRLRRASIHPEKLYACTPCIAAQGRSTKCMHDCECRSMHATVIVKPSSRLAAPGLCPQLRRSAVVRDLHCTTILIIGCGYIRCDVRSLAACVPERTACKRRAKKTHWRKEHLCAPTSHLEQAMATADDRDFHQWLVLRSRGCEVPY